MVKETRLLNGCDTGFTKISRGYDLPAKFVLHTVGPIGNGLLNAETRITFKTEI